MGTPKVSQPEAEDEKTDTSQTMALSSDQPSSVTSPTMGSNEPNTQELRSSILTENATTAHSKTGVLGDTLPGPSEQAVPGELGDRRINHNQESATAKLQPPVSQITTGKVNNNNNLSGNDLGPSSQPVESGSPMRTLPQPQETDLKPEPKWKNLFSPSRNTSKIGGGVSGAPSASRSSKSQLRPSRVFGGKVNMTDPPKSEKRNFSSPFKSNSSIDAAATPQSESTVRVFCHGANTAAESVSLLETGHTGRSSTGPSPSSQAANTIAKLPFLFRPRVEPSINNPFSSQRSLSGVVGNHAVEGPGQAVTASGLSRPSSDGTVVPSHVFGPSGPSSSSNARSGRAVTNATAGALFEPTGPPATGTTLTSQLAGMSSSASSFVPTSTAPGNTISGGIAGTSPNPVNPPGFPQVNSAQAAQRPYTTGPFYNGSQNSAVSNTLLASAPQHPQAQTATSATTTSATSIFGNTIQTGRTVNHPIQSTVTVATANTTTNQTQQNLLLPLSTAANNQHNHTAPQPNPAAAISNIQAHIAAPPANAAAVNHPQVRVVAPAPTAATNNVQANVAALQPHVPNHPPQVHVAAPPPNAAPGNLHVQVAAPQPNPTMNITHPHHPIAVQPPHAPTHGFHPPVAAPANHAPYFVTNVVVPNHNRPYPILATRLLIEPSDSTDWFRTSGNRIYGSVGRVDPVLWYQLQALGVPDGRETLLSNHGTLYVRGPDPVPRPRPWPRRRTSSPDAVAGRKWRDEVPGLLERLGPSEADVPDSFPSVEAIRAAVPEGGIKIVELVERFREFVMTQEGRERFGAHVMELLNGDLRFDVVERMLVPIGKGKGRETEEGEARRERGRAKTVEEMERVFEWLMEQWAMNPGM